jgi:hypothetical protein
MFENYECMVCRDFGWTLDADKDKKHLFLIPCPRADCRHSGRVIESLDPSDARFGKASRKGKVVTLLTDQITEGTETP